MHQMNSDMLDCIRACHDCHTICLSVATNHCLQLGGQHAEPQHIQLMLSCAEICQSAANFMAIGSERHRDLCRLCADVCRECARECEQLGDMDDCVAACLRCAESCERMAA